MRSLVLSLIIFDTSGQSSNHEGCFAAPHVAVAELPQTPEDDPQKFLRCTWKADELVTVGACVYVVMTMVG